MRRSIGQQPPQTGSRRPAAPAADRGRSRTGSRSRVAFRAGDGGGVRARVRVGDLDAVVALLTDDVFLSMPPLPLEYEGIDVVRRFYGA